MQVPEKLALIGGSILLASTLIFTLKSQANALIPKIRHSASNIYGHIGDAEFDNGYHQAQREGWQTGTWGDVKFYVDDKKNLYVGRGRPQGQLKSAVGADPSINVRSITFTSPVQAPANSWSLISDFPHADYIAGLDQIDVSQATDLSWAFSNDRGLQSINISDWQTPHLQQAQYMFGGVSSLKDLDVSQQLGTKVPSL